MKVHLWCIGKTEERYITEGLKDYVKRLSHYIPFEYKEIPAGKIKKASAEQHKASERDDILKLLKPEDYLVLLDERGKLYSSTQFAEFIQLRFNSINGNLVFLIGGAYGFHEDIYARANARLSLSPMTFTHQMVRLIFIEQLYRGMTILRNEPYHH